MSCTGRDRDIGEVARSNSHFGPVPIVFDFGFPLLKGDRDNTQIFNFAFGASF